jgi:glucokinase
LIPQAFNLEDPGERESFLRVQTREVTGPGFSRTIQYDPLQRTAVGISRLGTSEAVAIGAYAFALDHLEQRIAGGS